MTLVTTSLKVLEDIKNEYPTISWGSSYREPSFFLEKQPILDHRLAWRRLWREITRYRLFRKKRRRDSIIHFTEKERKRILFSKNIALSRYKKIWQNLKQVHKRDPEGFRLKNLFYLFSLSSLWIMLLAMLEIITVVIIIIRITSRYIEALGIPEDATNWAMIAAASPLGNIDVINILYLESSKSLRDVKDTAR